MPVESFRGLSINELTLQDFSEQPTFPNIVVIDSQQWKLNSSSKPQYVPAEYLKREGNGGFWLAEYMLIESGGEKRNRSLFWEEAELVKSKEVLPSYEEMEAIGRNKEKQPEFPQKIWDPHNEVQTFLQRVFWDDFQGGAWMGEYRYEGQQTERGSRFTYMTAMRNQLIA